jgi:TolB-like protein
MVYAVVGWLVIQVAVSTFPRLLIPGWAESLVIMYILLGFPVAIILAWAFELTPEGIKTTKVAQEETEDSKSHAKKRNWFSFLFGAAVPTLIFGTLAIFFYLRSDTSSQSSKDGDKSVAVLPFANMSDDTGSEYFSDGISEELLNVLAKVPNLRVPARTSSFYFKGKNMPVQEIGEALKVQYVLEGSVRKAGEQVRITAQLVKVADGYHMWSDTFTRDLKDIFALQDEIAGLIAKQLQLELGVTPRARAVDPEAHRLLLEARFFWNQRGFENFDKPEELLNRALEIDPDFAEAHATMAMVWVLRAVYTQLDKANDVSEELAHLRVSATRALELDPSLVEAMAAMAYGLYIERKVKESDEWFQKALAISPHDSTTNRHRWKFPQCFHPVG